MLLGEHENTIGLMNHHNNTEWSVAQDGAKASVVLDKSKVHDKECLDLIQPGNNFV